jgi:Concanavalin A-like lectin/glucanases superfamily
LHSNLKYRWRRGSVDVVLAFAGAIFAAACEDDAGALPGTVATDTNANMPNGGSSNTAGGNDNDDGSGGAGTSDGSGGNGETGPGIAGGIQNGGGSAGTAGGDGATDPACAVDTDLDGVDDCVDGCPMSVDKSAPGACGCDVLDVDTDFDGTLDCEDMCPADVRKTEPGLCGCGLPDGDSDTDGVLDCNEDCPFDATRTEEGDCGCGAEDDLPLCLRHRYSFDGADAVAVDSVGDADGTIVNTTLTGTGTLVLAGGDTDQHVDLPDGVISRLGNSATIEVWLNWTGAGGPWTRVFDFGSSDSGAGLQGAGATYLFVTPNNTINLHLRAAYTNLGPPAERTANGLTALPFGAVSHVALVIDGPAATMSLYQNGGLIETAPTFDTVLYLLNDVNNWIGKSQFIADEEFQGTIDEFRLYGVARTAAQIAADVEAGPNDLPAN